MNEIKKIFLSISNISQFLETWLNNNFLSSKEQIIFNKYYQSYINHFGKYLKYYYAQQTVELMNIIRTQKDPAILEIGCGCGTESLWMALNNAKVLGVDIQEKRLAVARKRKQIMEQHLKKELPVNFESRSLFDLDTSNKYDIIWMEQTFHHLEPRDTVFDRLSELLKENGYIIISEVNAWNMAFQLLLFKQRGFKTISEFTDETGKLHSYGIERIITPMTLCKEFKKRDVMKEKVRYFRLLPNIKIADKLLFIERKVPHLLKPLFTHYNFVGKKGAGISG